MANATISDMTIRQRDVAVLNAKYTKELADAKAENDALLRRIDAGSRMRVSGRCTVPPETPPAWTPQITTQCSPTCSEVLQKKLDTMIGIADERYGVE